MRQNIMRTVWSISMLCAALMITIVSAQDDANRPDLTSPEFGSFDPASIADITLDDIPVLPEWTAHAALILEDGQTSGRNAAMFSKVGDSMTASDAFLTPFAGDDYELGDYAHLQPLIDFINSNSQMTDPATGTAVTAFDRPNYATEIGFSTTSVLDPTWADSEVCDPNENPLACEYRISNSAYALIMFGTNDVIYFDEATFDFYYRQVVLETIGQAVVPVLYTFPPRPEEPERSMRFNKIIVQIARDYDLPLINLVVALDDLPAYGVDPDDPLHLTEPQGTATVATFTESGFTGGYTHRNRVTLQTLDTLLRAADVLPADTDTGDTDTPDDNERETTESDT